jgi:hypothetical protein
MAPPFGTRTTVYGLAAGFLTVCLQAPSVAQIHDVSSPPAVLKSAGPFRVVRLSRPPLVDGREWIVADVQPTASDVPLHTGNEAFSLKATDCADHGDFVRCRVLFQRGRAAAVPISHEYTGWVFVSPDGRYIVTEPLDVLDVREWVQYALADAFQIPNYANVEAVSRDGTRLLISGRDCEMDCTDSTVDYYELRLP